MQKIISALVFFLCKKIGGRTHLLSDFLNQHAFMCRIVLSILICFFISAGSNAQIRYKDQVFTDVKIRKNVSYKSASMPDAKKKAYLMDIYLPADDNKTDRPVIIWLHGGGFKLGKKTSRGIPIWCRQFAKKGYVCIAMNYRKLKGLPTQDFNKMAGGCFSAIEDINGAIAWCKLNFSEIGIDTTKFILAGNSAGSMAGLQAVYGDYRALAAMGRRKDSTTAVKPYNMTRISALINFWGGIFDSTWIANAKVPIVSVHGDKDGVAPYESRGPIHGSAVIYRQAIRFGIPSELKTYYGLKHELQKSFNPFLYGAKAKRRWLEAGEFASDFLYKQFYRDQ